MFHPSHRALAALLGLALLAGCSEPAPAPAPAAQPAVADAAPAAIARPAAPAITDEAGLRAAAATALAEQRIYAPAGDNTLEYYLALRAQRPDDSALSTALLELLPYALIGSEQAMAREDFPEARRLLELIERADPQAPSLSRLREGIVAAEAQAAQKLIAQAEADKLQRQQEQLATEQRAAAEQQRAAARAVAAPVAASAPPPVPAPTPAAAAPPVPAPVAAPAVAATRPAASPPAATRIPRLLSAPSPRYPMMALRRKLEGDVTVEFTIQPDGSVASPRVVAATPAGTFEEAALVATRRWRFEAGAGPVKTSRVVQFRLAAGG